jgi:hypothetical protein
MVNACARWSGVILTVGVVILSPSRASADDASQSSTSVEPSAFGPHYRSPGLAAALSLTPAPVDFGNFYAENVGWGVVYTSAEVVLGAGMMWIGADHMCHSASCSAWSGVETGGMIAMAAGYVAVKIVSAMHAAGAATDFDSKHGTAAWRPLVLPASGGAALGLAARF